MMLSGHRMQPRESPHFIHKREIIVFKSSNVSGNYSRFSEYLPCYVNIENLCMLLSSSATFPLNRCRCKCTGTFVLQSMHDLTPALSSANFCKVVNGVLNISPPFFSVNYFLEVGIRHMFLDVAEFYTVRVFSTHWLRLQTESYNLSRSDYQDDKNKTQTCFV